MRHIIPALLASASVASAGGWVADIARAIRRQAEDIDRWRETGTPASPDESREIYEGL